MSGRYTYLPTSAASSQYAGSPPSRSAFTFPSPFASEANTKLSSLKPRISRITILVTLFTLVLFGIGVVNRGLLLQSRTLLPSTLEAVVARLAKSTSTAVQDTRTLSQHDLLPPVYTKSKSGIVYPPDVNPANLNPYKRANATLLSLVRNNELDSIKESMRYVEDRFNRKFKYPWVFLNDEEFTDDFKAGVQTMTRSVCHFQVIPEEHWSYPASINQTHAALERQKMVAEDVIYGGSESYRHMCRFNSGFFFRAQILDQFKWYWRVEPGIKILSDVDYDPFLMMEANGKQYGFTIALYEYRRTIETLWDTVKGFARTHPQYIAPDNSLGFLVDNGVNLQNSDYNLCHFWSNFEIASLDFWRSEAYQTFFNYLDQTGGFFYERWGDAPVHSIAAALFLPTTAVHQFEDIGYYHGPFMHCPTDGHDTGKTQCDLKDNFDENGYSCMPRWWAIAGGKPT